LIYTQKDQYVVSALPEIYISDGAKRFYAEIAFARLPNSFFGVGNTNSDDMEEKFAPRFLMRVWCFSVR